MTDRRPGYAHGATIPLPIARWIATRIIDRVEAVGDGIRLHAAGGSLDLINTWGVNLQMPTSRNGRSLVALDGNIAANVEEILAYEKAHPDEPKIGARR